jgi:hypothetical protein
MQRTVRVWVNYLSLYPTCCGSCLMLQLFRCTFCIQSSVWILVILFSVVSCFITSMKERRTLFTYGTFCVHTSPRLLWKLRAPEFQGCYGHDHIFLGFSLYCCCHLLLLHLHQPHFNPQIRFLHQIDSPKFYTVQHLLYLSKVISWLLG